VRNLAIQAIQAIQANCSRPSGKASLVARDGRVEALQQPGHEPQHNAPLGRAASRDTKVGLSERKQQQQAATTSSSNKQQQQAATASSN